MRDEFYRGQRVRTPWWRGYKDGPDSFSVEAVVLDVLPDKVVCAIQPNPHEWVIVHRLPEQLTDPLRGFVE